MKKTTFILGIFIMLTFSFFSGINASANDPLEVKDFLDFKPKPPSEKAFAKQLRFFEEESVKVKVVGDTVTYTGGTNFKGYDKLTAIKNKEAIKILVINSLGGEVYWGMKIGEIVYDNQWDVQVKKNCFSSCANYVFVTGKHKVIEKNSIVAWHGSAQQSKYIARNENRSEKEVFLIELLNELNRLFETTQSIPKQEINQIVKDELNRNEFRKKYEKNFYKKIKVNAEIALAGFLPEHYKTFMDDSYAGWTFSIEDMKKFGVANITYQGAGAYPNKKGLSKMNLLKISLK